MKKLVFGIGGYMGSGKSAAGKIFEKLGARFIDADEVVDGLYQKGEDGYRKVISFFGDKYLTSSGELNRKKFAKVVFGDPKKLRILHDLIHPLVTNQIRKMVDQGSAPVTVIEATYFDKKHLQALVDKVIWIECPKDVLFERISKSRGVDRPLFERILRIQFKPEHVDFVVKNNGSKKELEMALEKIWQQLVEEFEF